MPIYRCGRCRQVYEDGGYGTNEAGEPICNNPGCPGVIDGEEIVLEQIASSDADQVSSESSDVIETAPVSVCRAHAESGSGNQVCFSCPTIEMYIEAVEAAEAIFHRSTPQQMVTALRKEWAGGTFNGGLFDWVLEFADTPPLDCGNSSYDFTISQRWVLACLHCLWAELHGCIEFGHVLCGVDATNFPQANALIRDRLPTSGDVIAAVTWAGDLGAAYIHMRGSDWEDSTMEPIAAMDQEAALDDLLADVDGVVLGRIHRRQTDRSQPFSQQLRHYYLERGAGNQADIFNRFVNHIYQGLDGTNWRAYVEKFIMGNAVFRSFFTPINEDNLNSVLRMWRGFLERGLRGEIRHDHIVTQAIENQRNLQGIR